MAGPVYYSTNPWISHEIARKYLHGIHFAWVSEYFDAATAPPGSAAAAIAPSSSPKYIYETLWNYFDKEDTHSSLIRNYKKTFRRLSVQWHAVGLITADEKDEIVATVESKSWKIWRPTLYVIPVSLITPAGRIKSVKHKDRAAYGPEMQIQDLKSTEFDLIEIRK